MKRICAWCREDMGKAENCRPHDSEVSHGICCNCLDNMVFQKGAPLQDYLDSISMPVLMIGLYVNKYIIAKIVNKAACSLLGKEPQQMMQHLMGNVFECAHARLPEGCGRAIHCSGCTIRRAVMKTYATGEPQHRVPATLKRFTAGQASTISMYVTTMKTANMVALRVDWFGSEEPSKVPSGLSTEPVM